jgi:hypothetical protein
MKLTKFARITYVLSILGAFSSLIGGCHHQLVQAQITMNTSCNDIPTCDSCQVTVAPNMIGNLNAKVPSVPCAPIVATVKQGSIETLLITTPPPAGGSYTTTTINALPSKASPGNLCVYFGIGSTIYSSSCKGVVTIK